MGIRRIEVAVSKGEATAAYADHIGSGEVHREADRECELAPSKDGRLVCALCVHGIYTCMVHTVCASVQCM